MEAFINMTYENRKLMDKESIKDNLKQVYKYLNKIFTNNSRILKSLDYSKKNINKIIKPATPHNTTQYLTSNFAQGRNEKIVSLPNEYAMFDMNENINEEDVLVDYMNEADDYCVPGGSMKDILAQQANIQEHSSSLQTDQLNPNDFVESNSNEEENEIERYKKIIEQQNLLISILKDKLNKKDTKDKESNEGIP